MGKLGKKARKFAKKNLQSILRRKRKTNALFKKKSYSKGQQDAAEDKIGNMTRLPGGREPADEVSEDVSLDEIFNEDDSDVVEDASDSDGFLYEESSCPPVAESKSGINLEDDNSGIIGMSMHNSKICMELAAKKKKLDKLKKKDPEFGKFLASYKKGLQMSQDEHMDSDEDETGDHGMQLMDEDSSVMNKGNVVTNSIINSWSQLVKEHNEFALTSLLNAYRAACHYGAESISVPYAASCQRIQNSETFCSILLFMLNEADNVFRSLLKIHSSSFKKEIILDLKNTSKWKSLQPLVKSYLRSTLFLLNQVTDLEILAFSLNRLRASIIFFAPFESLLHRLIKVSSYLWATGQGVLSSCSFFVLRDLAVVFSLECFDICFTKAYKAYISQCKVIDSVNFRHIQFLRNSLVELCSLDVHKSCNKAFVSIQHLAKLLKQGLRTKKKEALKKICSWQCANCIDLWVTFIAANIRDYDLHRIFYSIIQLINGVACLFPGPRYFPLRIKCIQWLNLLSSSSGIFIPVASFVLDVLEYKTGKDGGKQGKSINFSSVLKLPKHLLKSQDFQKECVTSAVELLSVHFSQWSCHISFPELATVPVIRLRKFHETACTESLKRGVKRLIDHVEQNVEFVRRKRDEVAFSPKDHQSVESFLQLEKCSLNAPFMQYYRSVMQKAASKDLGSNSI